MKTFKKFIHEALDPSKYTDKASKQTSSLFLGRMQPIHMGHDAIIKMMKNPVVALVKGAKSSSNKTKNPFSEKDQIKWIKKLNPKAKTIIAKTGYIPDMINDLRKEGIEINEILSGNDRISGYKRQIDSFNKQMPHEKHISVKFKETPRVTSATKVRNSLKDGDYETFKSIMPKKLHGEWDSMRKTMGIK